MTRNCKCVVCWRVVVFVGEWEDGMSICVSIHVVF